MLRFWNKRSFIYIINYQWKNIKIIIDNNINITPCNLSGIDLKIA